MMLEKNLDSLHEELLPIKEQLMQYAGEGQHQIETGTEQIDGREILYAMQEGKLFQLDTMYDEEAFLDIWMSDMDATFNTKFTMFGFGNGMFVRKLLAATEDETSVYIYEPSVDIFLTSLRTYDLTDLLSCERVHIWIAGLQNTDRTFYDLLTRYIDYTDVKTSRHCIYPNYNILYPNEHQGYVEESQQAIDSVAANRSVMERFGWHFYENPFFNAPYFCYGRNIFNLWSFFNGDIPAMIVSSGPSLSKNIEQIKDAKGKAFIIAADSAVKVLLQHDIIPDMFICVDPNKNEGHFSDPRTLDIPMLCTQNTAPAAMRNHRAPMFFQKDENPHCMAFLAQCGLDMIRMGTGGSVATVAMSFAEYLGIKTIILVGQDLAYTGNKTHAEGSLRADWKLDIDETKCYIEGQDGSPVLSSNEFKLYRDWFEREIAEHNDLTVINATEGGAKIHGAIQKTLKDTISEYANRAFDVMDITQKTDLFFTQKERELYRDYMFSIPNELEALLREVKKGIAYYEKMEQLLIERKHHSQKFMTYFHKIEMLSESLQTNVIMYYPECMLQVQLGDLLQNAYDILDDEIEELKESLHRGKYYYQMIEYRLSEIIPDSKRRLEESVGDYNTLDTAQNFIFKNEEIMNVWEQFMRMITPELDWDGYFLLLHNLESTLVYQEDGEYPKLLEMMFDRAKLLRKEMVLFKLATLSFLVEIYAEKRQEIVECIEQTCYQNELLQGRHLLYIWKNLGLKYFEDTEKFFQYAKARCIENVKKRIQDCGEIKSDIFELERQKAVVCILSSDEMNASRMELVEKCISSTDDRIIFLCTYEEGAWGGMIPLYHMAEIPETHPDSYTFSYQEQECECIVPKKYMPDAEGYLELLMELEKYEIMDIFADQTSIMGELLKENLKL